MKKVRFVVYVEMKNDHVTSPIFSYCCIDFAWIGAHDDEGLDEYRFVQNGDVVPTELSNGPNLRTVCGSAEAVVTCLWTTVPIFMHLSMKFAH